MSELLPEIIPELVTLRIKELEQEKGITCYIAADRGGFSHSTASALLTGKANPTIIILAKVCDGFGVTMPEFFNSKIFTNYGVNQKNR